MTGLDILRTQLELAVFPLSAMLAFAAYVLPVGQVSYWAANKTFGE